MARTEVLFTLPQLDNILNGLDLASIIRERTSDTVEETTLSNFLDSLPESDREALYDEVDDRVAEQLRQGIERDVKGKVEKLFDKYLSDAMWRAFGIRPRDLPVDKRKQIEYARMDLKLPGVFNPDA